MTALLSPHRGWHADYIGAPFKDAGACPEGWDCYGLVWWCRTHIYGDQGLDPYASARLAVPSEASRKERLGHQSSLIEAGAQPGRGWRSAERTPGAAVLLQIAGRPVHVGLMLHDGRFLHVDRHKPTCVEALDSPEWSSRVGGFYVPA